MVISSVDLSVLFSSERAYPLIYIESPSSSLPLHSQEGLKENIHVNIKNKSGPHNLLACGGINISMNNVFE